MYRIVATLALAVATAATAGAAEPTGVDPDDVGVYMGGDLESLYPGYPSHTFTFGVGAMTFIDADTTVEDALAGTPAGAWAIRYAYSPAPPIAWEFSYTGATDLSNPSGPALDAEDVFVTLLETDLRLNLLPLLPVYPFIGGGVGWGAFTHTTFGGQQSAVDDTTVVFPVLAGLEAVVNDVSLQARFTYRPTRMDDDIDLTGLGGDSWALTADVGARF